MSQDTAFALMTVVASLGNWWLGLSAAYSQKELTTLVAVMNILSIKLLIVLYLT